MKQDFLTQFIVKAKEEKEKIIALEKRKKHFQSIGRKGGLAKKKSALFSKIISTKVTEKEYLRIKVKAEKLNLKLSKYARLVLTEQELKINEFKTDEVLLQYGNHFIRISNLLRNREWNEFENKKKILNEIQTVTQLIRECLYRKIIENEQLSNHKKD
ncbi:plasmid mobilization protein [Bergeyella zoohelcum]|uniref:Special sigma factor n=1 Tax=Bergeyella zoohelcum ATCC 43767 TaxID=883096 RepID=K1LPS9_9FLAO|nr:hypothetical protein [Bergeyella zoohelcum]EKB56716.1 hypothetical protein HMPREF9699_01445 [Bergeyella zoohelcum ATCC 43767]SUV48376.1 Uncharacterised protein [Bergeyella zoohelcum]